MRRSVIGAVKSLGHGRDISVKSARLGCLPEPRNREQGCPGHPQHPVLQSLQESIRLGRTPLLSEQPHLLPLFSPGEVRVHVKCH